MTLTILNYYIVRVLHKSPDVRRHTSTKTGTVFPFEQLNFKITFFQSTFKNICLFCTSFLWMLFSLIDFNTFQLRSHKLLKVRQIRNDFFKPKFLPKNKRTNSFLLLVDLFLFVLWPKSQATKISRRFSVGGTRDAKVILRNLLRNYRSIKDLLQDQNTLTGCSVLCSLSVNIFSGDQQCG